MREILELKLRLLAFAFGPGPLIVQTQSAISRLPVNSEGDKPEPPIQDFTRW